MSVTVVPGVNDHHIWNLIRFAAEQRLTRVNFQSVVLAGRYPDEWTRRGARLTAGHFMQQVEIQSGARLLAADLMPCGAQNGAVGCWYMSW